MFSRILYARVSCSMRGISHSNRAILAITSVTDVDEPSGFRLGSSTSVTEVHEPSGFRLGQLASNVAPVSCLILDTSRQLTEVGCQVSLSRTPANALLCNAVLSSLVAGSRLICAMFQFPSFGRLGSELRGIDSVSLSYVPGAMVRYLTWPSIKILSSLSSRLQTSIESMTGWLGDWWSLILGANEGCEQGNNHSWEYSLIDCVAPRIKIAG